MALLATINSDPKSGTTFRPADFHPFMEAAGSQVQPVTDELLAKLGFKPKAKPEAANG